jgi:hypothetical protein
MRNLLHRPIRFVRLRFSLRTLLVFVAVAAAVLTAVNYVVVARIAQHSAARALVRIGAYVEYDDGTEAIDEDLSWDAFWFNVRHDVTKVAFRHIVECHVGSLFLDADPAAEHLRLVASFRHLKVLGLRGCAVNDEDLAILGHLPLEALDLSHTFVTDKGVEQVTKLTTLKALYLESGESYSSSEWRLTIGKPIPKDRMQGPNITDRAIRAIAHLATAETLDLRGSSIGNESVEHLNRLTTLRHLYIDRTNILQKGVDELKRANPKLEVIRDL